MTPPDEERQISWPAGEEANDHCNNESGAAAALGATTGANQQLIGSTTTQ
jgi:hypothetical protein